MTTRPTTTLTRRRISAHLHHQNRRVGSVRALDRPGLQLRLRRSTVTAIGRLAVVLAAKQPAHGLGRYRLHRRRDVRIQVQGDADLAVAEQVAHDLGVHALTKQQRGAAVAQVME